MARRRARHARSRRRFGSLLVITAVVLGTAVLGWWGIRQLADVPALVPAADSPASPGASAHHPGTKDGARERVGSASGDPAAPADDQETNVGSAVDECAEQLADVARAVGVGRQGVEQWSAHVQARTDMLEDRISEARMEAIYKRTTKIGHTDQQRFSAAVSEVAATPCRALDRLESRTKDPRIDECLTRARRAVAALGAATSTMEEWRSHLHHMESYDDGGMRTGKAMALWVKAWRKAPEGISTFRQRSEQLSAAPTCSGRPARP